MRSASPRVAQPNWSGPGTAWMAYDGIAFDPLLWITTSPVSGILSGMVASWKTHMKLLLIRPTALQNDLERGGQRSIGQGFNAAHGSLPRRG